MMMTHMIINYIICIRTTMILRTSRMKALAKFVYHKFIACLFMFPVAATVFSKMMISTLQMRKKLQKFLDSIIGKSGKCRALIRDIRQDFSQNPEMQRPKTHTHQSLIYIVITCMPMHDCKQLQDTPHHADPPGKPSKWSLCWPNWTQSTMLAARLWPEGSSTDSLLSF